MTQIPPNRTKYLRVVVAETAPTVEHPGPRVEERDSAEDRDSASLDEDAQAAFNPEGFIDVALPSGGWARVSPDVTRETLAALDRLMQASGPAWGHRPLPEDADIDAAAPLRTGRHDLYVEAHLLVGARQSKGALVGLVNWLLARIEAKHEIEAKHDAKGGEA